MARGPGRDKLTSVEDEKPAEVAATRKVGAPRSISSARSEWHALVGVDSGEQEKQRADALEARLAEALARLKQP